MAKIKRKKAQSKSLIEFKKQLTQTKKPISERKARKIARERQQIVGEKRLKAGAVQKVYVAPPKPKKEKLKKKYDVSKRVGVKRGPYVKAAYEKYKKQIEKIPLRKKEIIDFETFKAEYREQLKIPTADGKQLTPAQAILAIAGAFTYSEKQKENLVENLGWYIEQGLQQMRSLLNDYVQEYIVNNGVVPSATDQFVALSFLVNELQSDFVRDLMLIILRNVRTIKDFFDYSFKLSDINGNTSIFLSFMEVVDAYDAWDEMFDT